MPSNALDLAAGDPALEAAVRRGRKLLNKRALVAAFASAVPLPGLDWAVDAALLSKMIPALNREFGLAPEQIDQLDPKKREQVKNAAATVGSLLIGKFITRDILAKAVTKIGTRLAAKQVAKFVPMAGQLVAAGIGFAAIRYFGEEHMKDCIRVAKQAQLRLG